MSSLITIWICQKALLAQKKRLLDYGSEFMPVGILKPVFKHHPNWSRLEKILKEESDWPLKKLDPSVGIFYLKKP